MTTDDLSFALLLLKTISSDAICELWIVARIGAVAIATLQAFVENELETCPNRHRDYREALFRTV